MNALSILKEKIVKLIDLVKELKQKNKLLEEENIQLKKEQETLENSMIKKNELTKEKELTKDMIDGLVKYIDSIVGKESESK